MTMTLQGDGQLSLFENMCSGFGDCAETLRRPCPGRWSDCGKPMVNVHSHTWSNFKITIDYSKVPAGMMPGEWATSIGPGWTVDTWKPICDQCCEIREEHREYEQRITYGWDY